MDRMSEEVLSQMLLVTSLLLSVELVCLVQSYDNLLLTPNDNESKIFIYVVNTA